MADSDGLNISQLAADKDIIFKADNGSGGLATYFKLDGSTVTTVVSKEFKFEDNIKANFGTGVDLRIYHNGTDSFINNYTGDLNIANLADNKDIIFKSDDGSGGTTEYFRIDGGFSSPQTIFPDNSQLSFGNGLDLRIVHDGSLNKISSNNHDFRILQNLADGDMSFYADNGSGGTTEYFKLDGGLATGGTVYTVFPDNSRATFGTGFDLQIYHDATNSYIKQGSGGNLIIQQETNDGDIIFKSDDGSGGVTEYFRLDGSTEQNVVSKNMRFEDGVQCQFGAGTDLRIYHDGSDSYINETGTGDLIVKAVDDVYIRGNTHDMGRFNEQGVKFYYLGNVKLETNNTGVKIPTAGNGLQLVSPNGTVYTVTVDNSGNLVVT